MAAEGWRTATVAELQREGVLLVEDGNHGENRPRSHEIGVDGRPHIRAADLSGGSIDFDGAQRITDEACARIRKGHGRPLDVILSHKGTVGRVAIAPRDCEPFVCSPQTTLWRSLDTTRLDPQYLYAQVRSPLLQGQLQRVMHESDMAPYVSLTTQRTFTVCLPPIETQLAIAAVLGALDDKIESNQELGVIGRKVVAADYAQRADRAAETRELIEVAAELRRGVGPRYTDDPGGVMVLNQRCIRDHEVQFGSARRHDESRRSVVGRELATGDVLVNSTGVGTLGRVAPVEWLPEPRTIVDSHVTVVRADREAVQPQWLASALLASEERIVALGEGSTGQTELSRRRLGGLVVRLPSRQSQIEHAHLAGAVANQRAALARESRTLTAIRDALLPKLVSGQIRVPVSEDPEEMLGAAVDALDSAVAVSAAAK